jgi:hypothetical protein
MSETLANPADGLPKREQVTLPPTGWRPRPPTVHEKLDIIIRQSGRCAETGRKLRGLKFTRFDHRPPVHEREWDEKAQDTKPSATDIAFIRAVDLEPDKKVTGNDVRRMHKTGRIRDGEAAHAEAMARKAAGLPRKRGSIQSRGFDRRKRRHPKP